MRVLSVVVGLAAALLAGTEGKTVGDTVLTQDSSDTKVSRPMDARCARVVVSGPEQGENSCAGDPHAAPRIGVQEPGGVERSVPPWKEELAC